MSTRAGMVVDAYRRSPSEELAAMLESEWPELWSCLEALDVALEMLTLEVGGLPRY